MWIQRPAEPPHSAHLFLSSSPNNNSLIFIRRRAMASTGQQQSSSSIRHHHSSSTVRQYEESGAMIDAEEDAGEPQLVQPLYPVSEWDKKLGRIDANDVSADIYDIVIFFLLSMLCAISSTGGYISLFFCFLQFLVAPLPRRPSF